MNRERHIFNICLIVCLVFGFTALLSVYLPRELEKATGFGTKQNIAIPLTNLDTVIALPSPPEATPTPSQSDKPIVQFIPAARPDFPHQENLETKTPSDEHAWLQVPEKLRAAVDFWSDIFERYSSHQVVLHDSQYFDIVYAVLDVSHITENPIISDGEKYRQVEELSEWAKKNIADVLKRLDMGILEYQMTPEERRIIDLFSRVTEPDRFSTAVQRLRGQRGLSDRFRKGQVIGERYLNAIEKMLQEKGLPSELSSLIFVESMFNLGAHSSAGARGIWQFMRNSGIHYGLTINAQIDERLDPIRSTEAAIKLLQDNYAALGSWPLAINAYNAGKGRLRQAVDELGTTDIVRIIEEFKHPRYGFASRNFFPEFLAAHRVRNKPRTLE